LSTKAQLFSLLSSKLSHPTSRHEIYQKREEYYHQILPSLISLISQGILETFHTLLSHSVDIFKKDFQFRDLHFFPVSKGKTPRSGEITLPTVETGLEKGVFKDRASFPFGKLKGMLKRRHRLC
jgi:hypothetical protein